VNLLVERFHLPKAGNSAREYEDAARRGVANRRFAVADGASDSAFAGQWARLLVRAYVDGNLKSPDSAPMRQLRRRWAAGAFKRHHPWFVLEKARLGAWAALAGLELDESGSWSATAQGDACLFQVRGGQLMRTFPIEHSDDFNNRPTLLGSIVPTASSPATLLETFGHWEAGDQFLLCTDALAAYILRQHELGEPLYQTIDFTRTTAGFRQWLETLRGSRAIRNDDVTLLTIRVE
jgi:hypothetical protein